MRKRRQKASSFGPTLEDVARAAGVSVATVSRTLNSPGVVREKTKLRVAEAVAATGYTPHFAGRALALNRTQTIGAVIPTLNNAIFAQGVNAFEERLRAQGYTLLLAVSNYDQQTEVTNTIRMMERGVDGLMLVGVDHDEAILARLTNARTPFVLTWSYAPETDLPTVGFDNHGSIAAVVDHLVDLGHRDVGMIAGITAGNDRARARVHGAREALSAHGISLGADRFLEVRYSIAEATEAAKAILGSGDGPTALICGNDVIAYGALFAAQGSGRRVPQDVSITGFDDLPLSAQIPPGLTTVKVPAVRMGEVAADRLVEMVEQTRQCDGAAVKLGTDFVIRGTTAPPRR